MMFKSKVWQLVAIVLSAGNLAAVGYHAGVVEPWQAGVHAALALGFGLWAQHLIRRRVGSGIGANSAGELEAGLDALEVEVGDLRRELSETQERLDFHERMLTQRAETRSPQ